MKRILIITPFYRPGFKAGGPIKTIYNFINQLGDSFTLHLLTSDRDLGDAKPFTSIKINKWLKVDKAEIFYASKEFRTIWSIKKIIVENNYDYIYINSFFSFSFSIKIILLQKLGIIKNQIILAPRGEFSPGALEIKRIRKSIFLFFSKIIGLYKNIIWHSTSDIEAHNIRKIWGDSAYIKFAPNLGAKIVVNKNFTPIEKIVGNIKIVFLSRISIKKNLIYLLDILKSNLIKGEIILDIYGSMEDENYFNRCFFLAKSLPSNIVVSYKGVLTPEEVIPTLSQYHLFFFPTKGENFGHVILEALSAGCPLLLSDQTPWRDLTSKGVGWDINLKDKNKFIDAINIALNWGQEDFSEYSKNSVNYALNILNDSSFLNQYRTLFN